MQPMSQVLQALLLESKGILLIVAEIASKLWGAEHFLGGAESGDFGDLDLVLSRNFSEDLRHTNECALGPQGCSSKPRLGMLSFRRCEQS